MDNLNFLFNDKDFQEFTLKLWNKEKDKEKDKTYSLPLREENPTTGEMENLYQRVLNLENTPKKEKELQLIKDVCKLSIGELAYILAMWQEVFTEREKNGKTLTPSQQTVKDFDLIQFACTIYYTEPPKEAYKVFSSPEDFEKAKTEIAEEAKEREKDQADLQS